MYKKNFFFILLLSFFLFDYIINVYSIRLTSAYTQDDSPNNLPKFMEVYLTDDDSPKNIMIGTFFSDRNNN